jgi:hypothetical protein
MKTLIKITVILVMFAGALMVPQKTSASNTNYYSSYQVFYDELSPYGNWVYYPQYGYVWSPNVAEGFSPYATAGHWVFTFFGWTWVSDYPWGWAPFHYGRWFYDSFYGPMWIPGNEWAPAWVMWRRAPGYYGWAPMGPGYDFGYGYGYGHGHGHSYDVPDNNWVFVENNYITNVNITNYYIDNSTNTTIINNSTVIMDKHNNSKTGEAYLSGPALAEAQKFTGKAINPVTVSANSKPGQKVSGNEIALYMPKVEKDNSKGVKSSPTKVSQIKDLKPVNKGNASVNKTNANSSSGLTNKTYNKDTKQASDKNNVTVKPTVNNDNKVKNNTNNNVKQTPANNNVYQKQNGSTNNNINKGSEQNKVKTVNKSNSSGGGQKVNTYNNNGGTQQVKKQENSQPPKTNVRTVQPTVKSSPEKSIQKSNSGSPAKTKVPVKKS